MPVHIYLPFSPMIHTLPQSGTFVIGSPRKISLMLVIFHLCRLVRNYSGMQLKQRLILLTYGRTEENLRSSRSIIKL